MPKIRTTRTKKPPEEFEETESVDRGLELHTEYVLSKFSMITPRKCGTLEMSRTKQAQDRISVAHWHHANFAHAITIYELYHKRGAISLCDWLLKEGYEDANMIAADTFRKIVLLAVYPDQGHELSGVDVPVSFLKPRLTWVQL
ncbi:hypothetical protein B0H16DRAFT_107176 [Mycena metata]|uniref:Uncharacterized protein n=1 Tax=Mycena metata TaxID=1033252 RepID=A0AAD7MY65_9AGAR|nr:hypothetical protein B0H16DRAFT_107176 [Mycena metata]